MPRFSGELACGPASMTALCRIGYRAVRDRQLSGLSANLLRGGVIWQPEKFDRCQAIPTRNSKRMKRTFARYHYLLAPVLVCGHCGGKMYGEAQGSGGTGPIRLYYGLRNRRKRL